MCLLPIDLGKRAMLLRPAKLRELSQLYRQAAEEEATLEIKRRLASHALVLAQLAEKIERDAFVTESNIERFRGMLARALDQTQRKMIETLLMEERQKQAVSTAREPLELTVP
jgi:rubrerythrin